MAGANGDETRHRGRGVWLVLTVVTLFGCAPAAPAHCRDTASRLHLRDLRCDRAGPGREGYERALGCATAVPRDVESLTEICWPALNESCSETPTLPEACDDQF